MGAKSRCPAGIKPTEAKRGCPGGRKAMEGKRDAFLYDKPPVGLAPAEAELTATKAASSLCVSSALEGGRKRRGAGGVGS